VDASGFVFIALSKLALPPPRLGARAGGMEGSMPCLPCARARTASGVSVHGEQRALINELMSSRALNYGFRSRRKRFASWMMSSFCTPSQF
jgi:hypothetical protein